MESQKSVKFRRNFNGKVNSFHDFALKFPLLSLIWDSLEVPDSNKNFNIFEKIPAEDGSRIRILQLNVNCIFITKIFKYSKE